MRTKYSNPETIMGLNLYIAIHKIIPTRQQS